ncbi:uncharacterized protein EI90DRAFT_3035339 [Cantharellus anzutake]|uniref:uncharacterized protein n=1 Tax=Cantharellus anzutake TaxID=1750568 RepID=UPI0019054D73|nr:uncharacterized protein EI90DRAFT_3035339 [Cantharellus anzutake]KAF8340377.1 hypothetical protein EI90DRAFT_3035339 [Cantharellus anzutake]
MQLHSTCEHLVILLNDASNHIRFMSKYEKLVRWGINMMVKKDLVTSEGERPVKRKYSVPQCGSCAKTLHRPFVCLECMYLGCWKEGHIADHLEETGHDFALDVNSGATFCTACEDLIYHEELDKRRTSILFEVEIRNTAFQSSGARRALYNSWVPSNVEKLKLQRSTRLSCQGRKGFLNLGASCYLSVILQVLVHTPLLRRYYLSDKHPHQLCEKDICMECEIDKLLTEIYSSESPWITPTSFLYTLWRHAIASTSQTNSPSAPQSSDTGIAGYAQHDAHEVFITILNAIHLTSTGDLPPFKCRCIIHTVFGAELQSDVQCGNCGSVRSVVDPLLDLNLELESKPSDGDHSMDTLHECLRRYTRLEKLGENEQPSCQECDKQSENATRRLSLRKLPPVLSFQFKRFKQNGNSSTVQKVEHPVRFPATLDMSPFTTHAVGMKDEGSRRAKMGPLSMYEYELFAVVNHEGQMDTGHYTNYARYHDEWYRYDDEKVINATLAEVLRSKPYLCLYVKKYLDYSTAGIAVPPTA